MTGNKGEWSEFYVLLKLLADGKLYAADENINKIETIYYDILKIIKNHNVSDFTYLRNGSIKIFSESRQIVIAEIPTDEFFYHSQLLYDIIKNKGKGSFSVPELEKFACKIKYNTLKSSSNNKTDILLVVHDAVTGYDPLLGFSIKSRLGSPSTLLNASSATNFIYKVLPKNITDSQINGFNVLKNFKDKFSWLNSINGSLCFYGVDNFAFNSNLMLVDTVMPTIIAKMLENYYRGYGSNISDLTRLCTEENICNLPDTMKEIFYSYKIKEFLTNIALGMVPASFWNGIYQATGGYIIVKEDGEVLCYHIYNRNEFREYLFRNTKFDTASKDRHKFGTIFKFNHIPYLKLNLQIRFLQ